LEINGPTPAVVAGNNQSINQSIDQWSNRAIEQSINQSIKQSSNRAIEQSSNQAIKQSINCSRVKSINHKSVNNQVRRYKRKKSQTKLSLDQQSHPHIPSLAIHCHE
jgi:hypothetical protein